MGLTSKTAMATLVVCGLQATWVHASCPFDPDPDRYEYDSRTGFCYGKRDGTFFNGNEEYSQTDFGNLYRFNDVRQLQKWDPESDSWEPAPFTIETDWCEVDLKFFKINFCTGEITASILFWEASNKPKDEDDT